jgi:thioredoxin 1
VAFAAALGLPTQKKNVLQPKKMPDVVRTFAEFQVCVAEHELVAVDFTATWCGPCRRIGPVFARMATKFKDVHFIKVDVDENSETAAHFEVQAMPTFMFFHGGKRVSELVGASPERLLAKITELAARRAATLQVPQAAPPQAAPAPSQAAPPQAAPPQATGDLRPPVLK